VPAPRKLTDANVADIRRRVEAGEQLSALADEFGVNRKTIRRHLNALESAEREKNERIATKRLRRQIAAQQRKLKQRDEQLANSTVEVAKPVRRERTSSRADLYAWLDKPKNLSGRALTEALGLVGMRSPDGKQRRAVERADVERLLEEGWLLD
jgi:DNA-binding transcriptional regulator YhcF (GntR family)